MLTQYCIGKEYINPKRVLYVSSLHSADEVWTYGKKYFEFSSLTRNVITDLNNLKRFVEWVYMIKWKVENRTRNDLLTSGLFQAILKEDELADVNVILPMWETLKDTDTLNEKLKRIPSMVIYGEKDPSFIKNEG